MKVGVESPTDQQIDDLTLKSREWVEFFLTCLLEGHQKKNITQYIHILAQHVPNQMKLLYGIKRFTGQRKQVYRY